MDGKYTKEKKKNVVSVLNTYRMFFCPYSQSNIAQQLCAKYLHCISYYTEQSRDGLKYTEYRAQVLRKYYPILHQI